jgi:hypothetical protein
MALNGEAIPTVAERWGLVQPAHRTLAHRGSYEGVTGRRRSDARCTKNDITGTPTAHL